MANVFPTPSDPSGKGGQGELIACAWLLGLGYQVFRNVCASGPADIMIWHPASGEIHLIDVKSTSAYSMYRRADGSIVFPCRDAAHDDVHMLAVSGGSVLGFFRRSTKGAEFHWPLQCDQPVIDFDVEENRTWKTVVEDRKQRRR